MTLSAAHFDPSELGKSKVSPRLMTLAQPLGEGLLNFYFSSIQVSGQEHIPRTGPVIVAPTHRSRWDALLIAWAIARRVSGRDLRFMVTTTEMTGIQGWFIRRLGGFPVDVKRPESSSLLYSVALLNQGEMLVIFPEGGIFREKQIQPLKRGVARIALEVLAQQPDSSIQILPMRVGYDRPYPSWRTAVNIQIGAGIKLQNYDPSRMKRSSEALTKELQKCLQTLQGDLIAEKVV
ncbi:MAG: lysophospholipid acyltransferase family protein [Microcystaceae cyanobacterium]